jgi:glutathione peroxidase
MKTVLMSFILFVGIIILSTTSLVQAESINVHTFEVENMAGEKVNLSDYKGKALLIVNTASKCGFTKQYKPMESLYQKYKDQGFEVLAFPANNFGGQEPGSNEEIKDFCYTKYKTTFPLFAKSSVKGSGITPLYKYLTQESGFKGAISWNFNKFLIDPDGNVVARYSSGVDPLSSKLVDKLETILPN